MGPSVKRVLTIYSNGSAHLNKMATMPIYGRKHFKIFFSRTKKALGLNLGVQHWGLKVYEVYSFDGRKLTFDLSYGKVKLVHPLHLYGKNVEKSFSQNVLKAND